MNRIFSFIIFITIFLGIFFILNFYAYLRVRYFFALTSKWWYAVIAILTISFPLFTILERMYPSVITSIFYIAVTIWMGVLLIFVTTFAIEHLISFVYQFPFPKKIIGVVLVSIALFISMFAIVNARFLKIKTIEIPIKNLQKETRIVQLTDMHLGVINNAKYLRKVVEKTNNLNPDIVMITGDLLDSSDSLGNETYKIFNNLKAKTYFTIGNHETYEPAEKIQQLIDNTNIEILRNQMTEYKDIQIIGVDNPEGHSRRNETQKDVIESFNLNENKPTILMYHPPVDYMIAKDKGISLQLSGHTHNGQIFPFTLLVKLFYPKIKGLYTFDENFSLYVSPGTGTWGPPMRLGSNNEITLFILKPER